MNTLKFKEEELKEIVNRYKRRENLPADRYGLLNHYVLLSEQEKERAIIRCLKKIGLENFHRKKIIEIGCGVGNNLLFFLKLGFNPENIYANDLLEERIIRAESILPSMVHFYQCDARLINLPDNLFDIAFQSVVFTSIIDTQFKIELAQKMWKLIKPGGAILWMDFIYNNPFNKDVRGIPFREIKQLFPKADVKKWKIILAPPVGRFVTRIHPALYNLFNAFPFLRTHLLCWIQKNKTN